MSIVDPRASYVTSTSDVNSISCYWLGHVIDYLSLRHVIWHRGGPQLAKCLAGKEKRSYRIRSHRLSEQSKNRETLSREVRRRPKWHHWIRKTMQRMCFLVILWGKMKKCEGPRDKKSQRGWKFFLIPWGFKDLSHEDNTWWERCCGIRGQRKANKGFSYPMWCRRIRK